MRLDVRWDGSRLPFEGQRSVPVTVIPSGAQVLSAHVRVTPVDPGGVTADPEDSFVERIRFGPGGPRWGANITHGSDFVEVDFRTRRTLAAVSVTSVSNGRLQIDPGGTYVEINSAGAIRTPGDALFTFTAAGRRVLPSFVVARFKITNAPAGGVPDLTEVEIRSVPENVSLGLGDQPPFQTFLGAMTQPETSGDFASLLTEFLQTARVENGLYVVPLMVHSDTIARLEVAVTLEVLQAQRPLAAGGGESAMEFSVDAIPVGAATSFRLELPIDARAVPGRTAVRFQGAFDDTRIAFGPLAPDVTSDAAALVSTPGPDARPQAQAQPFTLSDRSLNVTGIDLLLSPTTLAAQVRVDIRDDLGGKPGAQSLLASPLKIDLHQRPSTAPQWLTVDLPADLHLERHRPLWLVVQRSLGDATWSVQAADGAGPGLQQTDDGGLSWRKTQVGTLTQAGALFRLRHRPPAFTMPIHVFVGEGSARREVPLAEFEPLGRVDFTLDTEQFAATINQVLSQSAAHACRPVEHLTDGDLEEWLLVGDSPGTPRVLEWTPASPPPLALAMSPDALYLYTLEEAGHALTVRCFDTVCLEEREGLTLSAITDAGDDGAAGSLAISTSGARLFAAFGHQLWLVDLAAGAEVGTWRDERGVIALASGGGKLFIAREGDDADPDILSTNATAAEASLAAGDAPVSEPFTSLSTPARSIAVTTAGDLVLAAFGVDSGADEGTLIAYDASGEEGWRIEDLGFRPGGVALSSAAGRGFVADTVNDTIHAVDLSRRLVAPGPDVTVDPSRLALAAIRGDRLAVAGEGDGERPFVHVIDFGTPVPKHWDITAGQVRPVCLGLPFHIGARLGEAGGKVAGPLSALSQVVAVEGGCLFDFAFWATASSDGAAGEVIWRGSRCAQSRVDTVPIRAVPRKITHRVDRPSLELHRARLEAPADATQAEVRFRASDGVWALVDVVSLKPPEGPLDNPDLQVIDESGLPQGWTLEPPGPPAFQAEGRTVRNLGIDPLTLLQEVGVTENEAFRLEFRGQVSHGTHPPIAALHWLDVGAPAVELRLEGDGADVRVADGVVPPGATRAEVSLTLPGGSEFTVEQFAMRIGVMTGVLFSVYAEAPGSLTVSQLQVVTDRETPAPPSPPDEGLCPATKPGDECRGDDGDSHYCPSCASEQTMRTERDVLLEARPARLVTCESCAATLVRHAGRLHPTRRALALPSFAIPRRPATGRGALRRPGPKAAVSSLPLPLSRIRGISAAAIRRMSRAGVHTLEQLAALEPKRLARLLATKSLVRARALQARGRKELARQGARPRPRGSR